MDGSFAGAFQAVFTAIQGSGNSLAGSLLGGSSKDWLMLIFGLCVGIEMCLTIMETLFTGGVEVLAEKGVKLIIITTIIMASFSQWALIVKAFASGSDEIAKMVAGIDNGSLGQFALDRTAKMIDQGMKISVFSADAPPK